MRRSTMFLRVLARFPNASSCASKSGGGYFSTQATSSQPYELSRDSYVEDEWNNLGFGLIQTDYMYTMKCVKDEPFKQGKLGPFGNIELSPSAGVLNYGQVCGIKLYRLLIT